MKQWGGITEAFTTCVDHAAHSVFYSLQVNCASSAPQSKCHFRHLSWVLILLFICLIPIKQIRKVRVDSGGKLIICFAFSVYAEVRMKTVHDETSESVSVSFLCPCCDRVKVDLWKCCFPQLLHIWDLASANIYIWYVCIFFFQRSSFGCHLLGCRSPLLRNKKPSSPALPKALHPKITRSNGLEITKRWHPKYLRLTPPSKKTARPRMECCTVLPVSSQF